MKVREIGLAVAPVFQAARAMWHVAVPAVAGEIVKDCLQRRLRPVALGKPRQTVLLPRALADRAADSNQHEGLRRKPVHPRASL
jgi:hypothetical protein